MKIPHSLILEKTDGIGDIMKITDLKVLICDDSILVRKKFMNILNTIGLKEVYEATDGADAVEKYKQFNPDLTFMDIVMPKMSGLEALEAIREYDDTAKIVMASTIGTQGNLTTAIKEGAYDFIQKPVKEEQVLRILNTFIM